MKLTRLRAVVVLIALVASALPEVALAEAGTGCPAEAGPAGAGWQFRSVESLAATGNAPAPGRIDAAGNNDGFVCALPLPDAMCDVIFDPCRIETLYLFRDNDVPGRLRTS